MKYSHPRARRIFGGMDQAPRSCARSPGGVGARRLCIFALFALLVGRAAAQDFPTDEMKSFYQSYSNLREISDFSGIARLVQGNLVAGEGTFDVLCERYLRSPSDETLGDCTPLASALDDRTKGTRFAKRLEYLATLDQAQWEKRYQAFTPLGVANQMFDEARAKKDQGTYRRALSSYEDALKIFEQVKDLEWMSFARYRMGFCHDQVSEYYAAVVAFDKAMDEWVASGRPKSQVDYADMVDRRRELIDRGYDPEGEPPDPTQMARNTSTSFLAGSDWEEVSFEYKALKKLDQFWLPSPWWSPSYLFWHQVGYRYDSKAIMENPNKLRPFDHELVLIRDGAKGQLDIDADGKPDLEPKIIDGKPTLTEISRSKDRNADRYGLYLTTGQQNMQWLGQQVNYQELAYYNVGSYREGEWSGAPFLLFDTNMTGGFGDAIEQRDGIVPGYPSYHDLDAMLVGKGKRAGPYSEYFVVGEQVVRLKPVDPVGRAVKVRPMDVDVGKVQVVWEGPKPPTSLVIAEVREFTGGFFDVAGSDPVTVPTGRYQISVGKIEAGSKNSPELYWLFKGDSKSFDVKKDEVTVLEMGGPYTCEFQTEDGGKTFTVKSDTVVVHDRMGLIVGRFAPQPLLMEGSVRIQGGGTLERNKKLKLISSEMFNENQQRAWFSEDLVVDKPASAKCEAMLFLKRHDVLGGPIESEWK